MRITIWAFATLLFLQTQSWSDDRLLPGKPFAIRVVDESTGRGVPLVELKTTDQTVHYTDSNGFVCYSEPGMMNRMVFFHVKSHGYEFAKDGFGIRGKALLTTEGGEATLHLKRLNVAERLYRVTGGGVYRDTVLLGRPVPIKQPILNAQVLGSDSVVTTLLNGKLHWFWGDTNRPSYPLGNFHVPGATSRLPADGGLDPDVGVDLTYQVDPNGFAKETARMPGEGPTWIMGLTTLRDSKEPGRERVVAGYVKVKPPMEIYQKGVCEYDSTTGSFERRVVFPERVPLHPEGHAFRVNVGGEDYLYFSLGYPLIRVKATFEDYIDSSRYEAFTPLKPNSRQEETALDMDASGRPIWAWKRNTPVLRPQDQAKLVRQGRMKAEDSVMALRDVESGKAILGHAGSVEWNPYHKRWGMIICEQFGTSMLGETWYAEAEAPVGPWIYARKVVTHDRYSFYNPKQHPYFEKDGGKLIYFEGTYTATFSGNTDPTPRYDYNQVMYRLDLDDPRLNLPEPVRGLGGDVARASFLAPRRPGPGLVGVYETEGRLRLQTLSPTAKPRFYAYLPDDKQAPEATVAIGESESEGKWLYKPVNAASPALFRAWPNPVRLEISESERGVAQ